MTGRAWPAEDRLALAEFVGDRPETVLAIHALQSGQGRVWVEGLASAPDAVIVESALVPGEPMGFGGPSALVGLLRRIDGWTCLELDAHTAVAASDEMERVWGPCRRVIDVVHTLIAPPPAVGHPLVRQVIEDDMPAVVRSAPALVPHPAVARSAVIAGRMFAAFDHGEVVGHGSSFAWSDTFADIGVSVDARYRRQGVARAAAAMACTAVQRAGLTPVWGTGSANEASRATARTLGFNEVAQLTYLVPQHPQRATRRSLMST